MPFNAIKLSFNFEGLCLPGLGTAHYAEIGSILMKILPRLFPATISEIQTIITIMSFKSNNGFDLCWRILELTVPGFDPTVPILPPFWHRDSDVFEFCQAHHLYFRLQAKKNNYFDARMHTCIFLRAVSQLDFADIVTLLQAQIEAYHNPDDDGFLPHHLWLSGIATLINNNAWAHIWDFATPPIHKLTGMDTHWDTVDKD